MSAPTITSRAAHGHFEPFDPALLTDPRVRCACRFSTGKGLQCNARATQEDGLCNHCRDFA